MATQIGTLGNIPTLTVAGVVYTDLTNLIVLAAYATGTNNGTGRRPGATSGYQVTAGKTLTIRSVLIHSSATTAPNTKFAQSDNDVGVDSGTALTSPIYLVSSANIYSAAAAIGSEAAIPMFFPVLATKYWSFTSGTGSSAVTALSYGYEA
jgi:hypothetical protein